MSCLGVSVFQVFPAFAGGDGKGPADRPGPLPDLGDQLFQMLLVAVVQGLHPLFKPLHLGGHVR